MGSWEGVASSPRANEQSILRRTSNLVQQGSGFRQPGFTFEGQQASRSWGA